MHLPIDKKTFKEKGETFEIMRLEDHLQPDQAYTLKEIVQMVNRTPMRVGFKLRQLEAEGKAERRKVDGKTYWMLTDIAYVEGSVKVRTFLKPKKRGRPRRW